MTAANELALAHELDRRLYSRAAQEVTEHPWGWSHRHHAMPVIHMLNAARLRAPVARGTSARDLVTVVDAALAGLGHRQVVVDDAPAAELLAGELAGMGWERERTQFMSLSDPELLPAPDRRAREIGESELRAFQLADLSQAEYGRAGEITELVVQALALVRAATTARGFAAGEGPEHHSAATLFLDPDVRGRRVAMIESVATLREHREQGLAKAAVTAAARAAVAWGAGVIVVPADADDWPQLLYAGLGFHSIGRQVTFTRRRRSA